MHLQMPLEPAACACGNAYYAADMLVSTWVMPAAGLNKAYSAVESTLLCLRQALVYIRSEEKAQLKLLLCLRQANKHLFCWRMCLGYACGRLVKDYSAPDLSGYACGRLLFV